MNNKFIKFDEMQDHFRGCLIGGAIGDALGAPVEFMRYHEIIQKFGEKGIVGYSSAYGGLGKITDDTQMTLFTIEGIIRAVLRASQKGIGTLSCPLATAYLRWLETQGLKNTTLKNDYSFVLDGILFNQNELFSKRAPGNTCISSLMEMTAFGSPAQNDSKGCGGVMRVAPVGLYAHSSEFAFEQGMIACGLTHGHPTGQIAGGAFSVIIYEIKKGASLITAIHEARKYTETQTNTEMDEKIKQALQLFIDDISTYEAIKLLGEGWVAEEALAISLYCALTSNDFDDGIIKAVNHSGDSDSTGAITGNILGLIHGYQSINERWLNELELKDMIIELSDDLYTLTTKDISFVTTKDRYSPY